MPGSLVTSATFDWGELEAALRTSLLKLQNLDSSLPPLPEGMLWCCCRPTCELVNSAVMNLLLHTAAGCVTGFLALSVM